MKPKTLSLIAIVSLLALISLCLAWEAILAPLRPGGSWMTLKVLPLMVPLFGILRGRIYTYQWSSMFILMFFAEGVTRAWGDKGLSQWLAGLETLLTVLFFTGVLGYVRAVRQERQAA